MKRDKELHRKILKCIRDAGHRGITFDQIGARISVVDFLLSYLLCRLDRFKLVRIDGYGVITAIDYVKASETV